MDCIFQKNVRWLCWGFSLAMLAAAWVQSGVVVGAQPPAAKAAPAEEGAGAIEPPSLTRFTLEDAKTLGQVILENTNWIGHVFYFVLTLLSVMAMAVAMERASHLRRHKIVPPAFVESLRQLLATKEDTVENLRQLCQGSTAPVAKILRAALTRAGRPLPEVEKAMEDAAARETAAIRSRNRTLSVLANVAPLVGLHGTVVGMIFAFRISSQAGLGKAELLAQGIYLALLTTAMGLTIAIPSLLLVAWFNARTDRYMREIDETLMDTMPSFARMEHARTADPA